MLRLVWLAVPGGFLTNRSGFSRNGPIEGDLACGVNRVGLAEVHLVRGH